MSHARNPKRSKPPHSETVRIAHRMAAVRESGTARMARLAGEMQAEGVPVLHLNVGEPDFPTPDFIAEAARRAIADGQTRYTDVGGTPELREAVAAKFRTENAIDCDETNVIVGTGAKQLIFNAMLATLDVGDEVIIPIPSWVSYPDMAQIAGAKPVLVPCSPKSGFKLTPESLAQHVSAQTRWVILNSPSNPTGAVYSSEELEALAGCLREWPGVAVLCDDIYERIIFDGAKFATMASVAPDIADRVLTVNGVSKSHAMTGWRIGYATGPSHLIAAMTKLQGHSTTNPSSIGQAAALAALTDRRNSDAFIESCRAAYQRRRDFLVSSLPTDLSLEFCNPEGAFYLFLNCVELFVRPTPEGGFLTDDAELCMHILRECGVATVPGSDFGIPGHLRLSFAVSDDTLEEALELLNETLAEFAN